MGSTARSDGDSGSDRDESQSRETHLEGEIERLTRELRDGKFALERVQQRLERTQSAAQLGTIEIDPRTGARVWSKETFRLFGFELKETPPTDDEILTRVRPGDGAALRRIFGGLIDRADLPAPVEFRLQVPEGRVRWLRAVAAIHRDPATDSPTVVVTIKDITARREAEDESRRHLEQLSEAVVVLERTRERLESAQAIVHTGDIELDIDDGGRTWSKEVFRLHGFVPAAEPPPLEQLFARVPLADQEAVRRFAEHAARGELLDPYDYRVVWPDGSTHWLRVIGAATYSKAGGGKRVAITVHDVTERKAFERELLATIERERELGRLKADFLHMITHEYRTPLGIVMSAAEILEHYFDRLPEEERVGQLQKIRRETRRLANLFEDVLLLGRAESGTVALRLQPLDLREVCQRFSDEVVTALGAERTVHLDCEALPPRLWLDERLLRHIFTNLVHNALKYSTLDRAVWISVRGVDDAVELRVRDEGIGIPAADMARLFQTFQRASNVGAISGSGIGLVVVKRCVELHGGAIDLQSAVGKGTEVVVRLPRTASDPSSPPPGEIHEQDPHPPRRGRAANARQPRADSKDGGLRSDRGPTRSRRRGGSASPPA